MIFSVLTVRRWRLNCMQLIVLYVYLFVLYPDYDVNVIYATSFWCEYVTGLSTVTHWYFRIGRYLYSSFDPQWQFLLFIFKFIFSYTSMGGGKGKKDINAKRKPNFLKHGKIRNSTSLTNLKQNQQPFLKNQQASMQNKRSPMLNQQSCTGLTLDCVQRGTCTCTLEKT